MSARSTWSPASSGCRPPTCASATCINADEQPFEIASGHVLAHAPPGRRSSARSSAPTTPILRRHLAAAGRAAASSASASRRRSSRRRRRPRSSKRSGSHSTARRRGSRMEPDGHVTVFTAQMAHGQGHETTLSQLVGDVLGVPLSDVRLVGRRHAALAVQHGRHRRQPRRHVRERRRTAGGSQAAREAAGDRRPDARGPIRMPWSWSTPAHNCAPTPRRAWASRTSRWGATWRRR